MVIEDAKKKLDKYLRSEEYKKYIKILEKIEVEPIQDPFETLSSKDKPKLKTNTVLDDLLSIGGGIQAGKLVEIYGGYGSGKTQTIFAFIAEASQEGTIILIDSEYTWSADRQIQVCKARGLDVEKMIKNVIVYQPRDYREQLAKLLTLPSPMDLEQDGRPPLKLIAIDSLIVLIDDSRDFRGRQKLPMRAGVIRDMLRALRNAARQHQCVVVFTNQVSSVPNVTKFTPAYKKEVGMGGNVTRHRPDVILYFRRTTDPIRIARLMDSSELPTGERVFQINEKGIDDVENKKKWMKEIEKSESSEEEEG